ncbi:HAD hydrolase-like protein [Mangrovicoccus algicola]|uniref:phosphoglycolate phosphatase n=1 Tax=Mangrovicoccus algicola TaxID=2771008 RepID=A0A8J6Z8W1_9RHOB|nr:HAD hydrolase-like protein [Mangrovicoccus algicola]MBE3640104.1 HAD hydrolase-like protein [Mangrovicoccus algicola]
MATVVFDLDGTLADTSGDLLAAANAVFRDWGYGNVLDPAVAGDRGAAMKGGRAMLRLGLGRLYGTADEARVDAGYAPLLDAYAQALSVETRLFPGAGAAIERLLAAGHRTAICTNKPEGLAEALMRDLGVRGLFGALVGADTLPVRKPDPKPLFEAVGRAGGNAGAAVLLGDTVTDRDCARNASIPCALVTFGPDGHDVAALHPEALIHHYDELDACLAGLGLA